jgi:sugar phosphate isomerase/epimerase
MERRNFLSGAAALAAGVGLAACGGGGSDSGLVAQPPAAPESPGAEPPVDVAPVAPPVEPTPPQPQQLVTQLWSRHLQWVSTQAESQTGTDPYGVGVKIGQALLASGYAAVDLTVRSDGHVLPQNVKTHLPEMLKGIRSTGAICDHIGVNVAPPADPNSTDWIASQFVHEILSVAAENGIKRYRFNNSGAVNFASNTFGNTMTTLLDGVRVNHQRLAAINAQYGGLCGVAHTHANNIGTSVYDYEYAMRDIDPSLIAINLAIGHTAAAVVGGAAWELQMRRNMPRIKCTAVEDLRATLNATTGALSASRVEPFPGTAGGGVINWTNFYGHLLKGGYSGAAESQIEYSIPNGTTGANISLNSAFWSDNANFVNGNLTPAMMIATMKNASTCIREQAAAVGWGQNGTRLL